MPQRLLAEHIGELVRELSSLCVGATVRDVQALPPRDLLLILRPAVDKTELPDPLRVRISVDKDSARLHLQQGRVRKHNGPEGRFYKRLREELTGSTFKSIEQVRGDRILLVEFRDTPDGGRRALLAELTGRHGNMLLLEKNDVALDLMIAEARPKKAGPDHRPRLEVGKAWEPPGGRASAPDGDQPSLSDCFPEPADLPPSGRMHAKLSWRVENSLGGQASTNRLDELRRSLMKRIERKLSRASSMIAGLERKRDSSSKAERVRMDAELITGAQATLKRGMKEAVLQDWFSEGTPERRIPLAVDRSPRENAEKLFARYKKLLRSAENVEAEIERAQTRQAELSTFRDKLEKTDSSPDELEVEAVKCGLLDPQQVADPRKKKAPEPRKPYKSFLGQNGGTILVGRTSRDNDTLTMRVARGNDLWFHTADT
ncbi:MAG: putative ribosome quality control (RQC) complex YloA/Tae2 family protein, partial [Planctomycetota bacterium]